MTNTIAYIVSIAAAVSIAIWPKEKTPPGNKYYGVSDGAGSFRWTRHLPPTAGYYCADNQGTYCTIVTAGNVKLNNGVIPNERSLLYKSPGLNTRLSY